MRIGVAFLTIVLVSLGACGGDTGKITGTVTADGAALVGAWISWGSESAQTAADGSYSFNNVEAGSVTVTARADWYDGADKAVDVAGGATAIADFALEVAALNVSTADANLYQTYSTSFDWTGDTVSLSLVAQPTQGALELAIYHRNPALYADPSGESQVTPNPEVTIGNLRFTVGESPNEEDVLDSVANDLATTGIDSAAIANVFHWSPAIDFLLDWNFGDASKLYNAAVAVRAEKWGGSNTLPAQKIERTYLYDNLGSYELWVEIVFEDFIDLAGSITDTNNDGYREVFGRIASAHIANATVLAQLNSYATTPKTTLELGHIVEHNLDELYSQTNPGLVSTTGVPYTHADLGTVEYPFAVIEHAGVNVVNVLLVEP